MLPWPALAVSSLILITTILRSSVSLPISPTTRPPETPLQSVLPSPLASSPETRTKNDIAAFNDYFFQVRYSDNLVSVGTLDLQTAVWEPYWAHSDSHGILLRHNQSTFSGTCNSRYAKPDYQVSVALSGQWGALANLPSKTAITGWTIRAAMFATLWAALQAIVSLDGHSRGVGQAFWECEGLEWQDAYYKREDAACGPVCAGGVTCPADLCEGSETAQCRRTGRAIDRIPTHIAVHLYRRDTKEGDAGALLTDYLRLDILTTQRQHQGFCGPSTAEAVGEQIARYFPIDWIGIVLANAIKLGCFVGNSSRAEYG
ncbi:hypothetical protein PYCC9005_000124 [Savitreella phatthalungensis]